MHYIKAERRGDINIWIEKIGSEYQVHVKDTARGMTEEESSKLFDLFYSRRSGGTGLGLNFCKTVMQAFGGRISVNAKMGEFSDFVLHFPKR